jgi:ABC-type nickel/cobalt efflux system permease component RcnA
MRRLAVLFAALAALVAPAGASAHPLGNFTTNTAARIELSGDRVYVLYVLDLAEIPTFRERGRVASLGRDAYASALAGELAGNLRLVVDGQPRRLVLLGDAVAFLPGAGGLETTRLELALDGGTVGEGSHSLAFADGNFPDRAGWRELTIRAEEGAELADASAPAESESDVLRAYPENLLESPPRVTTGEARFVAGAGPGSPPALSKGGSAGAPVRVGSKSESGFAALVQERDLSAGVVLVAVLVAVFWGAVHALGPGHGKAIVAAYMVGSRGTARHALFLGGIVAVTHTIGVFAVGFVTLALSEFIVPEELYPWLNVVSAVLVVAVGVAVLRLRLLDWLRRRGHRAGQDGHCHGPADHDHPHYGHDHDHGHGDDPGHEGHDHLPAPGSGLRGIVAVGISGGLLPCPTALVVLLAAMSLHRVGYGLLLIVAFSLGLAGAIAAIGLLAVTARRVLGRLSLDGPLVRSLPALSALVIVALGIAMTVRSLPEIA